MGKGTKSVDALSAHITKAERDARARREAGMLTGAPMREYTATQANEAAHRTFLRVKELMKGIKHDDAIHEATINRYCMITAEVEDLEHDRARIVAGIDDDEMSVGDMYKIKDAADKQLATKRKMLLDIERDCAMTVKGALAALPKGLPAGAETAAEIDDPMREVLMG